MPYIDYSVGVREQQGAPKHNAFSSIRIVVAKQSSVQDVEMR